MSEAAVAARAVDPKAIISLEGLIRGLGILTSIIAFACAADSVIKPLYDSKMDFTIAANVIAFIWLIISLLLLMVMTVLSFKFSLIKIIVLGVDLCMFVLTFIAGITAAVYCNKISCTNKQFYPISVRGNIPASSAFSFFTAILCAVAAYLSFKRYKSGPSLP